jgi:hypothetical protein
VSELPTALYRIVRNNPAMEDDFLSGAVRDLQIARTGGRQRSVPRAGNALHMWSGISAFSSIEAARAVARQHPALGNLVVQLHLQASEPRIRIEKTSRDPEHYTIWADPGALPPCVESIQPV